MRRGLLALAIAGLAAAACLVLITVLASRDSSQVGGGEGPGVLEPDRGRGANGPRTPVSAPNRPPTSGPHQDAAVRKDRTELSDDEILTALELGNVVIAYDDTPPAAVQEEVSGPFDPQLAAAGQAVILAKRPGLGGVQALAWRRRLAASGPDDPRLREFAEAWLGQGAG